jgi:hypothetical protein
MPLVLCAPAVHGPHICHAAAQGSSVSVRLGSVAGPGTTYRSTGGNQWCCAAAPAVRLRRQRQHLSHGQHRRGALSSRPMMTQWLQCCLERRVQGEEGSCAASSSSSCRCPVCLPVLCLAVVKCSAVLLSDAAAVSHLLLGVHRHVADMTSLLVWHLR